MWELILSVESFASSAQALDTDKLLLGAKATLLEAPVGDPCTWEKLRRDNL